MKEEVAFYLTVGHIVDNPIDYTTTGIMNTGDICVACRGG